MTSEQEKMIRRYVRKRLPILVVEVRLLLGEIDRLRDEATKR